MGHLAKLGDSPIRLKEFALTKSAGRIAGIHTGSAEMIRRSFAQGFDFASLLTDARIFTNAIAAQLAAVHQTTAEMGQGY